MDLTDTITTTQAQSDASVISIIPAKNAVDTSKRPGSIASMLEAEFPARLVIPVAPPGALGIRSEGAGKVPAVPTGASGHWRYSDDWGSGVSASMQTMADDAGANVGLVLGLVTDGMQFVALDLDMAAGDAEDAQETQHAIQIRDRIVKTVAKSLGAPIWVRTTRPGRGALLFRIHPDEYAGRKSVVHLSHPVLGDLGKIELLSEGQQVVCAGTHPLTLKPITWWRSDAPGNHFPVPQIDDALPVLPSRQALNDLLQIILSDLSKTKIVGTVSRQTGLLPNTLPPVAQAENQAPPSANSVLRLLRELKHDHKIDREDYVAVMHAAASCVRSLQQLGRATDAELAEIREAAILWAASWEDPRGQGTTVQTETEKWDTDWSQRPHIFSGWHTLLSVGASAGLEDLHVLDAQESFESFEPAEVVAPMHKPMKLDAIPVGANDNPITALLPVVEPAPTAEDGYLPLDARDNPDRPRARRRGEGLSHQSDMALADALQTKLESLAVYLEDDKRWAVWQGQGAAWSDPAPERMLRTWIENGLKEQVDKHFQQHPEAVQVAITSLRKIDNMEKMLRTRLGHTRSNERRNPYYLQTPAGAYDLRTGSKIEVEAQKGLLELRQTAVAPADVATPEFDKVMSLMCGHDPEVISWVWHYLGYLILGNPIGHNLLVINGPGGNGKGSFCRLVQKAMAGYAIEASRDLLLDSGKKNHKTSLYDLKGKRMWFVSEISEGESWNEAQVKSLSGGDRIQANRMHHDFAYFDAEGAFIVATNNLPKVSKVDDAILRRFLILRAGLKPEKRDLHIEERVVANGELHGILFKIMNHARKVYENGVELPQLPAAMARAAWEYFGEQMQDELPAEAKWLLACLQRGHVTPTTTAWDAGAIDLRDLRSGYEDYIKDMLITPMRDSRFGEFLKGIGFQSNRLRVESRTNPRGPKEQKNHYTLGSLSVARSLFDKRFNTTIDWLDLDGDDDEAGGNDGATMVTLPLKAAA